MDTGMLWFDDSDKPLTAKVKRAVSYYQQKYERAPNLCVVHPTMLVDGETSVDTIELKPATAVMPHHYWIGVHEAEQSAAKAKRGRQKAA